MQSKIRIEYDFDTKQPVLRFHQAESSDDLRDKMLKAFLQKAGWTDSRLYITYPEYTGRTNNSIIELRCEETVTTPSVEKEALLPSKFQIDDEVDYSTDQWVDQAFQKASKELINTGKLTSDIEYTPKYSHGKVVAVRFTTAKVWYDILDDFTGEVIRDVVSHQTKLFSTNIAEVQN